MLYNTISSREEHERKKERKTKMKIKNFNKKMAREWVIAKMIDGEWWNVGSDDDRNKANESALMQKGFGIDAIVIKREDAEEA